MGASHSRFWTICLPASLHFIAFAYLWRKQRNQKKLEHLVFEKIGHVTGIFIYPVKSCKGISLESSNCCIEGLELDRFVSDKYYFVIVMLINNGNVYFAFRLLLLIKLID